MATFNASSAGGTLNGSAQNDTINGSAASDQLNGLAGSDTIYGNAGNDTLNGGDGNDNLYGGAGDDILSGGDGNDLLDGGDGNDLLQADLGNDINIGGLGTDTVDYSLSPNAVTVSLLGKGSGGFANGDTWSSIEFVIGSAFNDSLTGDALDNTLIGGAGADFLSGGLGSDTASYVYSGAAVSINLATNVATGGNAQGDTFSSIENLVGSALNDTLTGDAAANTITAGDGNDFVDGGNGNDVIYGGNGDDTLTGNYGTDKMYGGNGNDTMLAEWDDGSGDYYDGGDGIDTYKIDGTAVQSYALQIDLVTGTSQYKDTFISIENLIGGQGNDVFSGNAGVNELWGRDGNDTIDGRGGNDYVAGENGDDTLAGGDGDDVVDGGAGKDSLSGGAGNDKLIGGAGLDALSGGDGTDVADYSASSVGVTVNLATGTGLGGDAAGDTLTGIENVTGSAFADVLTGSTGVNVLDGGAGDDVLAGGLGADVLLGGAGVDTADYSSAASGVTVNLATGTASDGDTLVSIENVVGSTYNDVLVSGAGANVLNGAGGVDTADYSASAAGVTVNLATGTASDGEKLVSVENVLGSASNDVLVSAAGANVLNGASGVDTADYSAATTGVTVNLSAGTASDGDTLLSIESVTGSQFNDVLLGDTGANTLNGGAGDDVLVGGFGADTLRGGDGIDTADYTSSTAAVTVNLDSGNGLGGSAEGDQLSGIENVLGTQWADVLTGNADANKLEGLGGDDTLHGLGGNDQIFGGAGDDRIYGGAGADLIDGGIGTDTADYRYSAEGVTVSLMTNTGTGGDAQGDVLVSIENLAGSEFDDVLTGNDGNNRIVGGMGADKLYGGAGDDRFDTGGGYDFVDGGAGIDAVTYDDSWGAVVVNLTTGVGSGAEAAGDTYLNLEDVTGSLFNDKITGNASVNFLVGLDGNDILDGGAGNDYLVGGLGADTLIGGAGDQDVADYDDAASGVVVNLVSGGTAGEAAGDTYSGVEYVYGSAFNDTIIGDGAVNRLLGNDGNDLLDGGAGNDVLVGGQGADTLIGGAGDQDAASYQDAQLAVIVNLALGGTGGEAAGDTYSGVEYVYGSAFNDQIIGDGAINRLTGGAGNDYLDGAAGNDYLLGDQGNDVMVGGAGADVFVFNAGFGDDMISDFWAGAGRTDRAWFQGVTGINSYADVLSHAVDSAAGVVISVAGQGSLTLAGVSLAQLNADDFLFG